VEDSGDHLDYGALVDEQSGKGGYDYENE